MKIYKNGTKSTNLNTIIQKKMFNNIVELLTNVKSYHKKVSADKMIDLRYPFKTFVNVLCINKSKALII